MRHRDFITPAIWFSREFPLAGGLISYGASVPDAFRQAGVNTCGSLKGQKSAETPRRHPTKFETGQQSQDGKELGSRRAAVAPRAFRGVTQ
jgi:putative ABC transport system substrate-binding protein